MQNRNTTTTAPETSMFQNILVSTIAPDPNQPRKHFDPVALADLAQSMEVNGLVAPVLVRPVGDAFMLVHGERRYRAALSLGWETIPAEVRQMSETQARRVALIENLQREALTPIEEARAFDALLQTGLTQAQLGKQLGKGQSYIAQKLRLLKMPAALVALVERDAITENHARQILKLKAWYRGARLATRSADCDSESSPDATNRHATPDELAVVLARLRPLDALWVVRVTPEQAPVVDQALNALVADMVAGDGYMDSWLRVATWFGCFTYLANLSVAELGALLDTFREQLYSAVFEVHCSPLRTTAPPSDPESTDWAYFWGYQSDARHAGVPQDPPADLLKHVRDWGLRLLTAGDRWLIPSNCQNGQMYAEQYRAAMLREVSQ